MVPHRQGPELPCSSWADPLRPGSRRSEAHSWSTASVPPSRTASSTPARIVTRSRGMFSPITTGVRVVASTVMLNSLSSELPDARRAAFLSAWSHKACVGVGRPQSPAASARSLGADRFCASLERKSTARKLARTLVWHWRRGGATKRLSAVYRCTGLGRCLSSLPPLRLLTQARTKLRDPARMLGCVLLGKPFASLGMAAVTPPLRVAVNAALLPTPVTRDRLPADAAA
jgi:hypothetical protein